MGSIAVVFPGQGSQYLGMGQKFHESNDEARRVFELAQKASGLDIAKLCFEGPLDELTLTVNLQPAVVAVDLVCWLALEAAGVQPVAVAGHSLGEYPALVACGTLGLEDCLRLVSLRGRLMDRDAKNNPGAMSAIMGMSPEQVAELCNQIDGVVQPANYNSPAQTVITGAKEAVAAAGKLAKERGAKAIPLKVSGAWHSPFMARAAEEMRQALSETPFSEPRCAHVPNTTGRPTQSATEIALEIQNQLTSPVRWVQTVQALLEMGVDTFIEAGPKNVLSGLIKKTAPKETRVLNFDTPQALAELLEKL